MDVERWLAAVSTLLISALLTASVGASAEEEERYPNVHGETLFELQNDWTFSSEDQDNEINDLCFTIEPSFSVGLTEKFSFEAGLVLESVFDPRPGKDRYVDDRGIFVEQLFLQYDAGSWGLRAGKINPPFGIAWDAAPGIYGVDFAEDYEITERIGAGGFFRFGNDRLGMHRLAADLFFLDTSCLSKSFFDDRGRTRRPDGGPSNTGSPESFAITLDSEKIPKLPGFRYHLGFSRQEAGRGGRDEYGYVAGLTYAFKPHQDVDVEILSEYVYQRGAEGTRRNRQYYSQSGAIYWKGWNLALSSTFRELDGDSSRDCLFQVSVGYEFESGLAVDVGYRFAREDGIGNDGLGALVSYTLKF